MVSLFSNPSSPMKFFLPFNFVAAMLALSLNGAGVPLDLPVILSLFFVAGLVGWTVESYSRPARRLTKARILRLPISRERKGQQTIAARDIAA